MCRLIFNRSNINIMEFSPSRLNPYSSFEFLQFTLSSPTHVSTDMMGQSGKTYAEEVDLYSKIFTDSEEEEWLKRRDVLNSLKESLPEVYQMSNYVELCEVVGVGIVECIRSERTQLCITAMDYIVELSGYLKSEFEPLAKVYLPVILKNCGRTNKIIRTKAVDSLVSILSSSGPTSWFVTLLEERTSENKDVRFGVIRALQCIIDLYESILSEEVEIIEDTIASGISDASPEVRDIAFKAYRAYFSRISSRELVFRESLDPVALKTLEKLEFRQSNTVNSPKKSIQRPSIASLKKQLRAKMQCEEAKKSCDSHTIITDYPSPAISTKSII
ncbi:hypothetical protein K7432_016599 [Basidiobolus ranarum]|uniref:TOG domain-containing protein n=1 Tax=Basidiobolus ranarum TaxID=34480 RepID=A0ABR2WEH0_9FUNG